MVMIGEVYADAGIHTDKSGFAEYSAMLKGLEGDISSFSTMTKGMIMGALVAPAVALGTLAAAGVAVATTYQDASQTLITLYGSVDTATEKFKMLQEFAAKTPFEFNDVLTGSIQLKNAGLNIEEYITSLGNAASVYNRSFEDATRAVVGAMNKEYESLKSFGITTMQVTKANYESLGLAAEDVGKRAFQSTDKYGKMIVKAVDENNRQAVASTVNELFGKFDGAMAARAQTITGLFSTLKDNVGAGLASMVGFGSEMNAMEIRGLSLLGVLQRLMEVAVSVTSGISSMNPALRDTVVVVGLLVSAIGLVAAGIIGYQIAMGLASAVTAVFGVTLSAAIWPATLIVLGIAAVVAGLYLLEQRTGLVTQAWQVVTDVFTIAGDYFSTALPILVNFVGWAADQIATILRNMIPEEVIEAATRLYNFVAEHVGNAAEDIHEDAENIRKDGEGTATSFDDLVTSFNAPIPAQGLTNVDTQINTIGRDAKTATSSLLPLNNMNFGGTNTGVTNLNTNMNNANRTGTALKATILESGAISLNGTNGQIVTLGTNGRNTAMSVQDLTKYLQTAGNQSMAGTAGQIAIVDNNGKTTNLTVEQTIQLLQTANMQTMSGQATSWQSLTGTINGATSAVNNYASAVSRINMSKVSYASEADFYNDPTYAGSRFTGTLGTTKVGSSNGTGESNVRIVSSSTNVKINTVNNNGSNVTTAKVRSAT